MGGCEISHCGRGRQIHEKIACLKAVSLRLSIGIRDKRYRVLMKAEMQKDYLAETAEAMTQLSIIQIVFNKLFQNNF